MPLRETDDKFGNPEERFRWWITQYRSDIESKEYEKFQENVKISRAFRANELATAVKEMKAAALMDEDYWYKHCGAEKDEDFLVGHVIASNLHVKAKEDTKEGSVETDASREIADIINDRMKAEEMQDEISRAAGDYFMDGMTVIYNRADGTIDPELYAPHVIMEQADVTEFVFDASVKKNRDKRHLFRKTRKSIAELKTEYPGYDFTADTMADYFNDEMRKKGESSSEIFLNPRLDFLEVEFVDLKKITYYVLPPEIAKLLGIDELLTKAQYEMLIEQLKTEVPEEEQDDWDLLIEQVETMDSIDKKYYYDCFANGKSLNKDGPRPRPYDPMQTKDGFSYTIGVYKPIFDSPYGVGQIYYQRDDMIIIILLVTLYMRQASRANIAPVYLNGDVLSKADIARRKNNEGGVYVTEGEAKLAEYRPHQDDIDYGLLSSVEFFQQGKESNSGVTPEMSGKAPFAQAPAALGQMLIQTGSTQLQDRLTKFFRIMEEALRKYYISIREFQGLKPIPDLKLEVGFDFRSAQEKDAEGLKAKTLWEIGLLSSEEVLRKNGYDDPDLIAQVRQNEDLGKAVSAIMADNPELAQMIQGLLQQQEQPRGGQNA